MYLYEVIERSEILKEKKEKNSLDCERSENSERSDRGRLA